METMQIPLSGKWGKGLFTTIDKEDYELIKGRKVKAEPTAFDKSGKPSYIVVRIWWTATKRTESLSRVIMGFPEEKFVDHVDRNPLNNSKSNLRLCTPSQNSKNSPKRTHDEKKFNTTAFIGVNKMERGGNYVATILFKNVRLNLGSFSTPEEAALNRDYHALQIDPVFYLLNFPDKPFPNNFKPKKIIDYSKPSEELKPRNSKRIDSKNTYVGLERRDNVFLIRFKYQGKRIYLGTFHDELSASYHADYARIYLKDKYGALAHPDKDYSLFQPEEKFLEKLLKVKNNGRNGNA